MTIRTSSLTAVVLAVVLEGSAQAQIWSWRKLPDPRGEFVRVSAALGRTLGAPAIRLPPLA